MKLRVVIAMAAVLTRPLAGPPAYAQTSFTEELLPNPLVGMIDADVYVGSQGRIHVVSTVSTTTPLFDGPPPSTGIALEYHLTKDTTGVETFQVIPDTARNYFEGFYSYGDNFAHAAALDGLDRLFFCWTKQGFTWTDVMPQHYAAPSLWCARESGYSRDSLFSSYRATTPSVAVGPDNTVHIAWASPVSLYGDSNYYSTKGAIMYRSQSPEGVLSQAQMVDSGFSPVLVSNAPTKAHLLWLRGDSSNAGSFQLMYRAINGGNISDAVLFKTVPSLRTGFTSVVDSLGVIHVLWSEVQSGKNRIFLLRYDGVTVAIDSSAIISASGPIAFAVSPGGVIHIAWSQYDGQRESLYYTNSRASAPFTDIRVFSSADITFLNSLFVFLRSGGTAGAIFTYGGIMHYIGDLEGGPDTTFVAKVGDINTIEAHPVAVDPQDNVWVAYGKTVPEAYDPYLCLGRFTEKPLAVGNSPRSVQTCALQQNYPNPFNPSTTIRYEIPRALHVTIAVYNALGQQVALLVDKLEQSGSHEVRFDGSAIATGMYFYRMVAGSFVQTRKLLILH